jgi:hypothetical protein
MRARSFGACAARVPSAVCTSGVIRGSKNAADVTMRLHTQADGRVRVEINVKAPGGTDAVLAEQLSDAYNRNLGAAAAPHAQRRGVR